MDRKARLTATLNGNSVDRPAVSFYEINGLDENPEDEDPFNIYSHPSWTPLIDLAKEKTDRIVMRTALFPDHGTDPLHEFKSSKTWFIGDRKYESIKVKTKKKILTATSMRDPDVNTVWQVEHLLKDVDDLNNLLDLPFQQPFGSPEIASILDAEVKLGDSGIVMIDTPDPLCVAASLFELGTYTIIATLWKEKFHQLLEKISEGIYYYIQQVSRALPGRLWRIYGPEYASPPYLHPHLFKEYVVNYDKLIIDTIHQTAGYVRLHCHGNIRLILDEIVSMNCDGIDPLEPPPQGDIELFEVREKYGKNLVLFGNLEASDLENMTTDEFEEKIRKALREGIDGDGRGFVLMPSSCPYGRVLPQQAIENYQKMVEIVEAGNY